MSSPRIFRAVNLFCCYNNEDQAAWEKLERHLAVLWRSEQIAIFNCHNILPGSNTELERDAFLETADLVLLLLSHNFVADDLCWKIMQQAMQKHWAGGTQVIPIRLSPVYYQTAPFAQLTMLPKRKPITLWRNPNEAYESIVESIYEIVKSLQKAWECEINIQKTHESVPHLYEQTRELALQPYEAPILMNLVQEDLE